MLPTHEKLFTDGILLSKSWGKKRWIVQYLYKRQVFKVWKEHDKEETQVEIIQRDCSANVRTYIPKRYAKLKSLGVV